MSFTLFNGNNCASQLYFVESFPNLSFISGQTVIGNRASDSNAPTTSSTHCANTLISLINHTAGVTINVSSRGKVNRIRRLLWKVPHERTSLGCVCSWDEEPLLLTLLVPCTTVCDSSRLEVVRVHRGYSPCLGVC